LKELEEENYLKYEVLVKVK